MTVMARARPSTPISSMRSVHRSMGVGRPEVVKRFHKDSDAASGASQL